MRGLILVLAAICFAAPSSAIEIARAPDYKGAFSIAYFPIYCVKAPCPPGNYGVTSYDGRRLATVKTVNIDPEADEALRAVFSRSNYFEGIAVEGDLWIDADNGDVTVRPKRALPGAWKTETTPPAGILKSDHPVTLVVVNKTRDVVRGIHVAPADADHWGPDRLNNKNLAINQRVAIKLETDDCLYDVRIVLGDRPSEEIRRQNVCEATMLVADRSGEIIDRVK